MAHDLFVHHFGSRTFAGNGIDAGKLMDENAGDSRPVGAARDQLARVALRPWKTDPESHVDLNGGSDSRGEENLTQSRKAAKRMGPCRVRTETCRGSSNRRSCSRRGSFCADFQFPLCAFAALREIFLGE